MFCPELCVQDQGVNALKVIPFRISSLNVNVQISKMWPREQNLLELFHILLSMFSNLFLMVVYILAFAYQLKHALHSQGRHLFGSLLQTQDGGILNH